MPVNDLSSLDITPLPDMTRVLQCSQENTTPAVTADLWNVWGIGPNDVYAVGQSGTIVHSTGGGAWALQHGTGLPPTGAGTNCFFGLCPDDVHGVWGSSANDVYAVGATNSNPLILHATNGGAWTPQTSPVSQPLFAIYGSDAGNVYVVGTQATILFSTGNGTWTQKAISPSTTESLGAVWLSGPLDIYAGGLLGPGGTVYHSTGGISSFSSQATLSSGIRQILGASANDVYAVANNVLSHSAGNGNWFAVSGAPPVTGIAITGTDLFAVGEAQVLHLPAGSTWSTIYTVSNQDMGPSGNADRLASNRSK